MRKKIAAANWKMNGTLSQWDELIDSILQENIGPASHQQVLLAVPAPYLMTASQKCQGYQGYAIAAQNCHHKTPGAYTGEVSAEMIASLGIRYCLVGHSERRAYFAETNQVLAEKVNRCLSNKVIPVFCCGEPLDIRDANQQNNFVAAQLNESLFHLDGKQLEQLIIAYEPIWAIGTGKTATAMQAQEMHAWIRQVLSEQYGQSIANSIPILYGGSVKGSNAAEIFSQPDVDGGLVGGASLVAAEFCTIIRGLP